MSFFAQRHSPRVYFGLLTLLPIAVLFLLVLLAPPDGNERSEWLQFLGAFHPIAVHLPIAILVLVPLIELAGRTRFFPQLLSCVDFLLGVATCGAIATIVLGWCLARSGCYSGSLVTQHMWGGVAVAGAAWLCWVLHARSSESHFDRRYILALIATVGLVLFTGYRGGQLSQGENHLTEHMPDRLRSLLGMQAFAAASSKSDPSTFYGARIQPVFSQHCIGCHGPSKHKANLRLDSYEAVIRGSKDGPVIKAGNAQGSELFRRVNLPPTDDDFMPSGHKPPLSSNEIKRIELWISTGASGTTPVESVKDVPGDSGGSTAVAEVTFEEIDPAAVAKQRARLASAVAQLQKRFPSTLDYESRGSAGLVINVSLLGSNFGDNELSALAPVTDQIVYADFSGTAITDQSAAKIASMRRLRSLRLAHTKVTDATLKALVSLSQLESLNLFDTAISPDALTAIGQLPKLQHLYLHETKISPDTPMPDELKKKITF
jgi:uncharacterized membrane protein